MLQPFCHSLPFALYMQNQTLSCGYSSCQPSILCACLHSRLLTGIAQGHCVLCALNYIRILMFCMLSPLGLLCTLPVWICLWLTCVSCHSFPLEAFHLAANYWPTLEQESQHACLSSTKLNSKYSEPQFSVLSLFM